MRRITIWLMSTVSALVLLFSYPTSTNAKQKTALQSLNQESTAGSTGGSTASAGAGSDSGTGDSGSAGSATTADGSTPTQGDTSTGSTPSDTSTTGSGSSGGSGTDGTFTGDSIMTRWGLVQVAITVKNGAITKSEVVQVPWNNPRDQQINSYAVPILNQEVVTAQSSQIDMVSGATVTSDGYVTSLQSAIDQAHLS